MFSVKWIIVFKLVWLCNRATTVSLSRRNNCWIFERQQHWAVS